MAVPPAAEFVATPGKGARARVEGAVILVGNGAMMAGVGVDVDGMAPTAGQTVVWIAVDGELAGSIALADRPRPSSKDDVARLRARGLEVVMLTGDSRQAAEAIARDVGIETVHAEVLPGDKAAVIQAMQGEGREQALAALQWARGCDAEPLLLQALEQEFSLELSDNVLHLLLQALLL